VPALRLERDEEVAGVVAWFGEDRGRRAVHLIVRGEDAGCLLRTDLYDLMGTRSMGFGDAARAILPGASTGWQTLALECPEPGCEESPVYALSFDPAAPPRCRLHPNRALAPL
jgi:hypothetical protein